MNRLESAQAAYFMAFRVAPPEPWGVSELRLAEAVEQAVVDRQPVPESFDWWNDLPPDAVA